MVDDDVALLENNKSSNDVVGSRGLCGTVLIEKIAGALAEKHYPLNEIKEHLEFILKGNFLRTLGVSLSGRVPLPGEEVKQISHEEQNLIEVGLGIHGETGRNKIPIMKSSQLAEHILR